MKKIFIAALFLGTLLNANMAFGQTETSGRDGVYRAAHTKMTELKHTKLKVNFDYQKEQMNGEEWLTASPYFYATDSLVLNAKAMLIHEVALDKGGSKTPLKFDYKNDILKINLDKTYNKNQDYTVYIKYTARPGEVKQKEVQRLVTLKACTLSTLREKKRINQRKYGHREKRNLLPLGSQQ